MGSTQSSMITSFETLAKEFYSNPDQVIAVENYEMNEEPMILPDGSTVHGTVDSGAKKGIPAFGFLKFPDRKNGGTCILREKGRRSGEMIIVFIPAGFRNGSITNGMQPYKSEISESGLSSFWHLLAITENITYTNAVTLTEDKLNIVQDKKELLEKAMRILVSGSKDDIGSYLWMKNLDGVVQVPQDNGEIDDIPINIVRDDLSEECKHNFDNFESGQPDDILEDVMSDIGYFYHVHTQATVYYGHMHAIAMNYRTKCYDCLESKAQQKGLVKNISVDEIVEYVKSGKIAEMKLDAIIKYVPPPQPEPEPES